MKKFFMPSRNEIFNLVLTGAWVSLPVYALAVSPEWKYVQDIRVAKPGLSKVRLPVDTLGSAQPSLTDLRLFDGQGQEVPFLINQPQPIPERTLPLEHMVMTMDKKRTVITGSVPAFMRATGFQSIIFFTPTQDFLKPITLEGSMDGRHWTTLVRQAPIFKQAGDTASSAVQFDKGTWGFLRLTLDDHDTPPLRISAVYLYAPEAALQDLQEFEPEIQEQASDAHQTEIRFRLPARDLPVDSIHLDVSDATFRRQIRFSEHQFSSGDFRDVILAQGSIYRITLGSGKTEELLLPIRKSVEGPWVTITIENGDSPPLTIRRVTLHMTPRDLIFDARTAGVFELCSGNPQATARDYDLAALREELAGAALQEAKVGQSQQNPAYQLPASEVSAVDEGSDIDTDPWLFRKKIEFVASASTAEEAPNLWRIELDPEILAHNAGHLDALRLVRRDQQFPYVIDNSGVQRSLNLSVQPQDSGIKGKSRWVVHLPYAGVPITQVRVTIPETLFQRTFTLYEDAPDENVDGAENKFPPMATRSLPDDVVGTFVTLFDWGTSTRGFRNSYAQIPPSSKSGHWDDQPKRILGSSTWTRIKADAPSGFDLLLQQTPRTDRLILETDNGDNPPVHVTSVQAYYAAPRLLFRSRPEKNPMYLYYGQPDVVAPQYDLNLIAAELLSTPPQEARLGPEEKLKAAPWQLPFSASSGTHYLFWGVMVVVVLGLLVVIVKLLPEEQPPK